MHEAAVCVMQQVRRVAFSREITGPERGRGHGREQARGFNQQTRQEKRSSEKIEYLIAPEEFISAPVLEAIPNVQELSDPVGPDVICVLFCLIPA